jgi:hypothetical protein
VRTATTDHLLGLARGDVVVSASTQLARLAIDRAADDPWWRATVLPIFERVGGRRHRPGGDATHTMPPAGIALDAADRRVLPGWLAH